MKSEFGKGLIICLVKFAEHFERWDSTKKLYEEMRQKSPDPFFVKDVVEHYFNAAADHLYEIEVPPEWEGTKLGRKVKQLRDYGLRIGHSFNETTWTEKDVDKAHQMAREIALMIDRKIGLKPDIGNW